MLCACSGNVNRAGMGLLKKPTLGTGAFDATEEELLKKPRFAWDWPSPLIVIPAKAGIHFCLWPFAWTSLLPAGEDTDAAIYIHLIRSGLGRGVPSRESESNAKTKAKIIKWIPAFAGMTVVFPHRGGFSTAPSRGGWFCRDRSRPRAGNEPVRLRRRPFRQAQERLSIRGFAATQDEAERIFQQPRIRRCGGCPYPQVFFPRPRRKMPS